MITETMIDRWITRLRLPSNEGDRLRLYIWWGMFTAFHTYLLLAVSAISQVEPRPLTGGLGILCDVLLGLSAFSFILGSVTPPLMRALTPKLATNPFIIYTCQLFWFNATPIFALIIAVIAGRFQLVLWPTAVAFIGMAFIYPRSRPSRQL